MRSVFSSGHSIRGRLIIFRGESRSTTRHTRAMAAAPPDLVKLFEACRAAWPQIAVPREEFLEQAAARLQAGAPVATHGHDLYLACACLRGDPQAIAELEEHYLTEVRKALKQRGLEPSTVEEALQLLRERVLVGDETNPARIGEYGARGSLAGWLWMAGLRIALNLRRAERTAAAPGAEADRLLGSDVETGGELAFLKTRHREQVQAAFESALASLDARARTLLRLHFIEGMTARQVAQAFGASRATVNRWLKEARETLMERTRTALRDSTGLDEAELDSVVRLVRSQLDVGISRFLRTRPPS
jgi:RNA polymerase sigma-70 factor, ECF subfamily